MLKVKKYKECPGLDFLFNKIYNPIPGQKENKIVLSDTLSR